MISVLIPIYNYTVANLVREIHNQLIESEVTFEIILLDDNSDLEFINQYQELNGLAYTHIIYSEKNSGIISARKKLSEQSQYEWLLFLDADVELTSEKFIRSYLSFINKQYEAIFGGYSYSYLLQDAEYSLRYFYGKSKEAKTARYRNSRPYKFVISGNFAIKKVTYLNLIKRLEGLGYGSDTCLGILLKQQKVPIYHSDNPVNHKGLDTNIEYLKKMEKAAETLLKFANKNEIPNIENDLLKIYLKLKSIQLDKTIAKLFRLSRNSIRKNLLSSKPNINLLQLYRLGYICFYSQQTTELTK
ncbi:glycosyltransferase family 2 protein [Aegicerativicinus sediminis]|uniref:glycosyltransferase family 2 protein n=1 Tax=Aegicerativicinus sediminis TaxID=2893202 RepID=UPI001E53792C|nr:glycosyltransferase family 2 protein [Aegicerativicinus sediminis]